MRDPAQIEKKPAAGRKKATKAVDKKAFERAREVVEQKMEAVLVGDVRGKEHLRKWGKQAVRVVTDNVPEELMEVALTELKQRARQELLKNSSVSFTSEDTRCFLNMLEEQNLAHFYVRSKRIRRWIETASARVAKGIEEVCRHPVSPEVHVVKNPDIACQALALGSGAVIIELSLLEMLESQDELDFILAHEFAHIALGHSVTLLNVDMLSQKCLGKFVAKISENTGGLFDQKLLKLKRTTEGFVQEHAFKALRHSDEFEADAVACRVLHSIGARRNAGETLMRKFRLLHGENDGECHTHPSNSARILRLNDITDFKWNPLPRDFPAGARKTLNWARKVISMKARLIETMGWLAGISLFSGYSTVVWTLCKDDGSGFLKTILNPYLLLVSLVLCTTCGSAVRRRMYHLLKS